MIGLSSQVGGQKFFARGPVSPAQWLDGNEDRIDRAQFLRIVDLKHPPLLRVVIHVKDSEIFRDRITAFKLAPGLERDFSGISPVTQIEGIEDQRFALTRKTLPNDFFDRPLPSTSDTSRI